MCPLGISYGPPEKSLGPLQRDLLKDIWVHMRAASDFTGSVLGFDIVQGSSYGPLVWPLALSFLKGLGTMGPSFESSLRWCYSGFARLSN